MGNFYEIDEILNEAVMTGVPSIIVEGVDDLQIYTDISKQVPFDVEIYAIENIENFGEGCEQVISAITELNSLPISTDDLKNNILGIIDKDVRDFRGEIPTIEPILVLNYYSIESHFVSQVIVEQILSLCSKTTHELITDELCSTMMEEIEQRLLDLYYFSLEALKNAVERDYDSTFSYSYSCGRMNDEVIKASLLEKKEELDSFAEDLSLTPCLDTLKCISKGKWLIDTFSNELLFSINNLQEKCENNIISTCKSCITEAYHKCLYRIKDGINKNTIMSLSLSNLSGDEFSYIVDRITSIKN